MVGACALRVKSCNILLYPTRQAGNIICTHILAVFVEQKKGFDPFHSIIVASSHTPLQCKHADQESLISQSFGYET